MWSVSVIIKWFLCSSVGVISPQDAVTAERDVMENYHLHRPRALECSPASSPVPPQEERDGKQKHKLRVNEVLEGGSEGGGVLITYLKLKYILSVGNSLSLIVMVTSSWKIPSLTLSMWLLFTGSTFNGSLCLTFSQRQVNTFEIFIKSDIQNWCYASNTTHIMYHNEYVVKEDSISVIYHLTKDMMILQYLLYIIIM